jgi:hypothetical protein
LPHRFRKKIFIFVNQRQCSIQKVDGNDALKAPLASPTFTGAPVLPTGTIAITQLAANNSTAVATTAYVDAAAGAAVTGKQNTLTNSAGLAGALDDETGTGLAVFATSPTLVTPNLGTPTTLVGTNITGTAAGLTAGTVTTNANLTGVVTSIGNATAIANGAISNAMLANAAVANLTGTNTGDQTATTVSNGAAGTIAAITVQDALNELDTEKAPLASPTFTGSVSVNGSATNSTAFNAATSSTIDFTISNLAYTTNSPGSFTLSGIKDGGTYTLAVQGTTSGTSTFSTTGFTFSSVNNGTTTSGKQTLYTFIVMGTTVYYFMAAGF